jgi:PAS domain S-box-containing protein
MDNPPPHHSSVFARLLGLLEATRLVRNESDLPTLLDEIARTIAESLGFGTVAVNLYRPAWDAFEVTTVHGGDRVREALLGARRDLDALRPLLDPRFELRGAYFVPEGEFDWGASEIVHFVPDLEPPAIENAWRPEDALLVPLHAADGGLLGIISVDEPTAGRRPTVDEIDVLVAVSEHAALALESAQASARAESHRAALERLLAVSARLNETREVDEALDIVCSGISEALGYGCVSVELHDPRTGVYTTGARLGTTSDAPPFSDHELARLLDPQFELEGCYLLPDVEARRRVGLDRATHRSEHNGSGPHAWDHHWLIVPLVAHGRSVGFLWADDPVDRLLPTRDRLLSLRAFANHAAAALDAATQAAAQRVVEARTSAVLQTALDAVVTIDHAGRIVELNPAAQEIFGWTGDELGGPFLELAIPPAALPSIRETLAGGVASLLGKRLEVEFRRSDGRRFPAEVVLTRIELGDAPFYAAWVRDVSRDKARDEELREAAAKYRTLVEGLPLTTYINELGLPVRTRWMSPQIEQLLGFPAADWLQADFFVERVHPDDRERVLAEVERTHATGVPFRGEYRLLHRDGHVVHVRDETIAVRDDEYRPLFLQGFLVDVGHEPRADVLPLRAVS